MKPTPLFDLGGRMPQNPADAQPSGSSFVRGPRYACRQCDKTFNEGLDALEHHVSTDRVHRIYLRAMPHWADVRWEEWIKQGMERRLAQEKGQ